MSIDYKPVEEWADIAVFLQASKGSEVNILLENQGHKRGVQVLPHQDKKSGRWLLGIALQKTIIQFFYCLFQNSMTLRIAAGLFFCTAPTRGGRKGVKPKLFCVLN